MANFVTWLRQHPTLIAAFVLIALILIIAAVTGHNNDVQKAENQKDENERVRANMNTAAAARTAATPAILTGPTPKPISDQEKLERDTAAGVALKVVEQVDKILELTDTAIGSIDKLGGPRKITRMEFLFLAANVIDEAEKDPKLRKRLSVDKNGKFKFEQVAGAAFIAGLSVSANAK